MSNGADGSNEMETPKRPLGLATRRASVTLTRCERNKSKLRCCLPRPSWPEGASSGSGSWQQRGRAVAKQPSGSEDLTAQGNPTPSPPRGLGRYSACLLVSSDYRETASRPLVHGANQTLSRSSWGLPATQHRAAQHKGPHRTFQNSLLKLSHTTTFETPSLSSYPDCCVI